MQKGGEGVQIACKIAYVINGRPPTCRHLLFFILSSLLLNSVLPLSQRVIHKDKYKSIIIQRDINEYDEIIPNLLTSQCGSLGNPVYPI